MFLYKFIFKLGQEKTVFTLTLEACKFEMSNDNYETLVTSDM